MLLLVLILVMFAFALFVVALLSSSVLWAWVSVGLSVAAAAVLLADWRQRRSAASAGAEPELEPTRAPSSMSEFDPVTEIFAVVPMSDSPVPGPGSTPWPDPSIPARPRFDAAADGQQTVVMSAVQPSGSLARPPGAESDITPSSAFSSPSVVFSGFDNQVAQTGSGPPEAPADPDGAASARVPTEIGRDSEATVMVNIAKWSAAAAAVETDPPRIIGSGPADAGGSAISLFTDQGVAPLDGPVRGGADIVAGGGRPPVVDAPAGLAHANGEAPEESHDLAVAALVSGLDDEVSVIDEQPRYHLAGCRVLVTAQPIPLPAREAVELGFTPCGWCSPGRALAGRHAAAW